MKAFCRKCKTYKGRFWSGRWDSQQKKIYLDDDNKRWNGLTCSPCKNMATYEETEPLGEDLDTNPMTLRICLGCGKNLPACYYYWHAKCRPAAFSFYFDAEEAYGSL